MALNKWELNHTPGQNDYNRWQLKLSGDEQSLLVLINKLPGKRGRPFLIGEDGFDLGIYIYEMSGENITEICSMLSQQNPQGVVAALKDSRLCAAAEKLSKELGIVFISREGSSFPQENSPDKTAGPVDDGAVFAEEEFADAFQDMELNKNYVFDEFVIGPNNRFTAAAAQAVADNPAKIYNPFFIYGGVGLGKTHLMHAVGNYVRDKNLGIKVLYVSTEKFMSDVIDSIRQGTLKKMRDHYRKADLLLVDDIQFLEESESTQEEFFHTFNTLHQNSKQIIITSDKPPKRLTTLEDRLRSRFEWGLIADIKSPNLETRVAILKRKEKNEKLNLDDNLLLYIASKLKSNIRELEGFLKRINAYASLTKQEVNIDLVKSLMSDLLPEGDVDAQPGPDTKEVYEVKLKGENSSSVAPRPSQTVQLPSQNQSAWMKTANPPARQTPAVKEEPVTNVPAEPPAVPVAGTAGGSAKEEIVIVKKSAVQPHGAVPGAAPQMVEQQDTGLKSVDVGFFFPSNKTEELSKVKERFKEVIKKHKLKFKLESLFEKGYEYIGKIDYSIFFQLCSEKNAHIAVVLGPPPETEETGEEFSNILSTLMDEKQISLQLVPWADLSKDYRYLNLALDITLLKHRG
jgi:chromosomal replication initiator protein DnaA